ncbi:MAG: hypothetical protein ABWZ91_00835 [Nocardioides sp.]
MTPRRLILHVGLSKSGTTALQAAVATSRRELAGHGVAVPLSTRPAVNRVLLRPLGWQPGSGFVGPRELDPLARLARCLRAVTQDAALISSEDLAELDQPTASSVVALARAQGFHVQLVVTARAWTSQLPSEYQQFLKHRLTDAFPDFLGSVRAGEGFYGRHFRLRQDLAGVCARWAADVPPEDVHVVVLPRRGQNRNFIFTEVAGILGVPASLLPPQDRDVNASYGVLEAEVYRRLNVELARLVPSRTQRTYGPVRRVLSHGALRRGASARIELPADQLAWVSAESTRQVNAIAEGGYCVHGDLAWLLADARDTGCTPVIREEDVARAAIETLARFAARTVLSRPVTKARDRGDNHAPPRWVLLKGRIGRARSRPVLPRDGTRPPGP